MEDFTLDSAPQEKKEKPKAKKAEVKKDTVKAEVKKDPVATPVKAEVKKEEAVPAPAAVSRKASKSVIKYIK